MSVPGPLCDSGRCARLLTAMAESQRRQGDRLALVVSSALDDAGVSGEVRQRVEAALVRRIAELVGTPPKTTEGTVAA